MEERTDLTPVPQDIPTHPTTILGQLVESAHREEITTLALMENGADLVRMLGGHIKKLEEARTAATKPIGDGLKALNDHFKKMSVPLEEAKAVMLGKMIAFRKEEDRKAREEQERLRIAAEEKRITEAAALEEAGDKEGAQEALEGAVDAPQAIATTVATVRGDLGSTSYTVSGGWDFEVANFAEVPRSYLVLNPATVRAAIKNGARNIPGLRIFEKEATERVR